MFAQNLISAIRLKIKTKRIHIMNKNIFYIIYNDNYIFDCPQIYIMIIFILLLLILNNKEYFVAQCSYVHEEILGQ